MGAGKGGGNLFNLPARLLRAEINSRDDGDCDQVESLINTGIQGMIVLSEIAQSLVMINLDQERDTVGITASNRRQHTVSGGDAITACLYCQFDDIFWIKILGINGKGRAGGVLDALIHR